LLIDFQTRKHPMSRSYETILGKKWYYRLVSQEDKYALMDDYPIQTLDRALVVCLVVLKSNLPGQHNVTDRREDKEVRLYSVFRSYPEYYHYCNKFTEDRRTFFEIILGEYAQKPHFDIDIPVSSGVNGEDVKDDLIEKIVEIFQEKNITLSLEEDVLVYTSHGSNKHSYHIVITNYCHANNQEAKALYTEVCKRVPDNKWIDSAVYSPRQQFRILGCQKLGSHRPKVFQEKWNYRGIQIIHRYPEQADNVDHLKLIQLEESLISQTSNCRYLPVLEEITSTVSHNRELQDDLDIKTAKNAINLAVSLSGVSSTSFPYKLSEIKGNIIILKRLRPSFCRICQRKHEHENPFMVVGCTQEDGNKPVYFHCRRANNGIFLGNIKDDNIVHQPKPLVIPKHHTDLLAKLNTIAKKSWRTTQSKEATPQEISHFMTKALVASQSWISGLQQ
jgi:hypothetical protein